MLGSSKIWLCGIQMTTYIKNLAEIKKPGQYRKKGSYAPPLTIDTEWDKNDDIVYVINIKGMWIKRGHNLKSFKTLSGAVRHLEDLATKRFREMELWL